MKCITESETDDWLRERSIPKDPYHGEQTPVFYLQFYASGDYGRTEALLRHYYEQIIPESDSLVHMTDWGLYQQSEMTAIVGIRSSHDESRWLIDAPGHILAPGEKEVGVGLFSLSASFAWSSYLYADRNHTTLYNWEGEVFDFWTESEEVLKEMRLMLAQFDLNGISG